MEQKKCPSCGVEVAQGLKYCSKCGTEINPIANKNINNKKQNNIIIICVIVFIMLCIIVGALNNKQDYSDNDNREQQEIIGNDANQVEEEKQEEVKKEVKEESSKEVKKNFDEEIDIKTLTDYYYDYGYRQGNVTYFGKKIKTSAYFNSADSSWPKIVYMDGPSGSHYSISCGSFKGDTFKKMSKKNKGDIINFIGKVDELVSSNNYKSGILGFDDCEIVE